VGRHIRRANDSFHIAVIAGDGIGHKVMAPALEVLSRIEATTPGLKFRFTEAPAGAGRRRALSRHRPVATREHRKTLLRRRRHCARRLRSASRRPSI